MADNVHKARRRNLLALAEAAGGRTQLAAKLDTSVVQLNHIVGKTAFRNLGERLARRWEEKLGLENGWLDHEHPEPWQAAAFETKGSTVVANEPREFPVMGGAVSLEQLDVRASMGPGIPLPERETVIDLIRVPLTYVREKFPHITSPKNLKIITGFGDSMKPTFSHGDPLIVDTGVHTMDIDTIYTFAYQNELYIKRIQRLPDRSIKVISDNRAVYDPYILDAKQREEVQVIARVICAVNMNTIS